MEQRIPNAIYSKGLWEQAVITALIFLKIEVHYILWPIQFNYWILLFDIAFLKRKWKTKSPAATNNVPLKYPIGRSTLSNT